MTLDYNLTKVHDTQTLHNVPSKRGADDRPFPEGSPEDIEGNIQWRITEALIWYTMPVGMSQITERNWREFAERVRIFEVAIDADPERYITPAMVHRRIGLSTNASSLTKAQFKKQMFERMELAARRTVNAAARDIEKETDKTEVTA